MRLKIVMFLFVMGCMIAMVGLTGAAMAAGVERAVEVIVDGKKVAFPDEKPRIDGNSRVLIPVRFVSEALGADVHYADNIVTITQEERVIGLTIGQKQAVVNGETVTFDSAAVVSKGRTLVPLRFVSEALGETVAWDNASRYVWIGDREVPEANGVAKTFDLDSMLQYFGEFTQFASGFPKFKDGHLFTADQLPIRFDRRRGSDELFAVYRIWEDEKNGFPVVKIHYSGRDFDVVFLSEDNMPRPRTNMAAWRENQPDGSTIGTFKLITSNDLIDRNDEGWESFDYEDIKYVKFSVDTVYMPFYQYSR